MLRLCSRASRLASSVALRSTVVTTRHYADIPESFKENFKQVAPNLDLPKTSSDFLSKRPEVPATIPDKLTLNFSLPTEIPYSNQQVEQVIFPASAGQMGVLPGHVPTIAELKPGVLSILSDGTETKYFVSSGFAFVHPNSVVDICAVEAVKLDTLDPEEVKKGLALYLGKLNTASTDLEKAEAQIGVEVHTALNSALGL